MLRTQARRQRPGSPRYSSAGDIQPHDEAPRRREYGPDVPYIQDFDEFADDASDVIVVTEEYESHRVDRSNTRQPSSLNNSHRSRSRAQSSSHSDVFKQVSSTISKDTTSNGPDRKAHILANWNSVSQAGKSPRAVRDRSPNDSDTYGPPRFPVFVSEEDGDYIEFERATRRSNSPPSPPVPDEPVDSTSSHDRNLSYAMSYLEASRAKARNRPPLSRLVTYERDEEYEESLYLYSSEDDDDDDRYQRRTKQDVPPPRISRVVERERRPGLARDSGRDRIGQLHRRGDEQEPVYSRGRGNYEYSPGPSSLRTRRAAYMDSKAESDDVSVSTHSTTRSSSMERDVRSINTHSRSDAPDIAATETVFASSVEPGHISSKPPDTDKAPPSTKVSDPAIERLCRLGFNHEQVLQVYLACDKNEQLAANRLYDQLEDAG